MMMVLVNKSINGLDVKCPMQYSIKEIVYHEKNWQRGKCIHLLIQNKIDVRIGLWQLDLRHHYISYQVHLVHLPNSVWLVPHVLEEKVCEWWCLKFAKTNKKFIFLFETK